MKKYSILAASILALSVSLPAFADDNVNSSSIAQIGSGIVAAVAQDGSGNHSTSTIDQGLGVSGNNLDATIHQGGLLTTNDSSITQDGSNQTATLEQHGDLGTSNFSSTTQDGTDNSVDVLQNGTTNTNDSTTIQHGLGGTNVITVDQGGMNNTNSSSISQNGSTLTATVTQN